MYVGVDKIMCVNIPIYLFMYIPMYLRVQISTHYHEPIHTYVQPSLLLLHTYICK